MIFVLLTWIYFCDGLWKLMLDNVLISFTILFLCWLFFFYCKQNILHHVARFTSRGSDLVLEWQISMCSWYGRHEGGIWKPSSDLDSQHPSPAGPTDGVLSSTPPHIRGSGHIHWYLLPKPRYCFTWTHFLDAQVKHSEKGVCLWDKYIVSPSPWSQMNVKVLKCLH